MFTIGLDAHYGLYVLCILDRTGQVVQRQTIRGNSKRLMEFLDTLEGPFQICYEASCGYGHLYDQLLPRAKRVVVAHPGHLRLIYRSKRKSDRVDALKLAQLLHVNVVRSVHVPSQDVRSWRQLIEYRHREVAKRTRAKNSLRSLLRSHGIDMPKGATLWTNKGRTWLAGVELPTPVAALQRDLLLDELESCEQRVARVERQLTPLADGHPAVSVLRTIPGVGIRTAEAIVAYIDQAERFQRSHQVGSYFGLVPCQDQSAGTNRLGRITREGPATARKMLVEAAWQGIRRSDRIRQRYERYLRNDVKRKKIALVATAHHLVRTMYTMLKTGESWREAAA